MHGTAVRVVLSQDVYPFGRHNLFPAIRQAQVELQETLQSFCLHGKPVTGVIEVSIDLGEGIDNLNVAQEP
jgi:hypothetical protein